MLRPLRYVFWMLARFVVTLRYRVRVHGLEQLRGLEGPTVVLPNHPGYIDPVLVFTYLWPKLHFRPLVYEVHFRNPFMWLLAKMLNALRVPYLEQASVKARDQAEKAVTSVIDGLKRGENFVLWPSGRLQRDGVERLGGARALTDILREAPEANVVLVRSRGVWGSTLSFAWTGQHPHLISGMLKGAAWLLANLLFFMPRRTITITVERLDRGKLPELRRELINPWFEDWYNAGGFDGPTYVPYHFLTRNRTHEYPEISRLAEVDLTKVKPETKAAINQMVADKLGRPLTPEEERPETTFDRLGLDSLDRMDLMLHVEQRFGFSGDQVPVNLGQVWALAQGLAEKGPPKPPPPGWFKPASSDALLEVHGDTVPAAFVARALASPRDVALADDLAGVLTYERALVGALVLAKRFKQLPGENVGLMLPASVAGDLALLGLHLAGKLPVLLNWTTGPANLAHAARVMELRHVVSSRRFLDRSGVTVEGVEFVHLEKLTQAVGKWEKLRTLLRVRLLPGRVRARVPHADPHRPAVVLFTSGSEKAPKAVPLTHENLLSCQRAGIPVLGLRHTDSVLGFLPAFHSFGLQVTGLLPLLGGMRVVYHPDPTDAGGLARKIAGWKPTFVAGTPTFMSYILDRAKPGDLDSLHKIIVGAEKCPPALFERVARLAPQALLLEGYGITECSPVVSVNGPGANRPGTVGHPLPGVEVRVVDLESGQPLPVGKQGLLLVSGPTIFPGYIAHDGSEPFREQDGKRWYVTGDLAEVDEEGFIHFAGRLKRFLKAGGEMISLPALEEPFARLYPPTQEGPRVAVEGVETEEGRRIVLFTTEPVTLRDANALLLEQGLRGVMRLDEVRQVEHIPVLGTGKTDYKVLRAQVLAEVTAPSAAG